MSVSDLARAKGVITKAKDDSMTHFMSTKRTSSARKRRHATEAANDDPDPQRLKACFG
jgi:hypothetical protein